MLSPGFLSLLGFGLFAEAIFALDMASVLKEGYEDASVVTWAHAVNGHQALEAELEGPIDFLEADISLGHVSGNEVGPPIPIMAHPPDVTSDISLERWLDIVIARQSGKGIKLDFKSIDIVEPSLQILQRHKGKLHFPLWLNADILPGPVNAKATPVLAEKFLALCEEYFPNATLSVGWTTYWIPKSLLKTGYYSWKHVREMSDTLRCFVNANSSTSVTFPVRGVFASRSITQLTWLLEVFPLSTLTVWSGKFDDLKVEDLIKIRESFPKSRVFYDIPEKIGSQFLEKKTGIELKSPGQPTFADHNYVKVSKRIRTQTCSSHTYITGKNIMFGKETETLVLLKETFVVTKCTPLIAEGEVTFFGSDSPAPSNEQLELILALAEVKSSCSRNLTSQLDGAPEDDTNVSWAPLNSSQLHVFRKGEPSEDTSCHFFRLDTTATKPFQAWTVNCDQWQENPTAALSVGTPEVSSKKRLILPPGPLVFGVISTGGGHVVVNNLMVKGKKSASSDSGASSPQYFKVIFLCIVLACFSILYSYSVDLHFGPAL